MTNYTKTTIGRENRIELHEKLSLRYNRRRDKRKEHEENLTIFVRFSADRLKEENMMKRLCQQMA